MRTNIEIDDDLMEQALASGPYKTKKEAVEAGLKLMLRHAAAQELLKLEGKLAWGWGDEDRLDGQPNWSAAPVPQPPSIDKAKAQAPAVPVKRKSVKAGGARR